MTYFVVLAIGCWECAEQTDVIFVGTDESIANRVFLVEAARWSDEVGDGPSFGHREGSCIRHAGRFELHKVEVDKVEPVEPVVEDDKPREDAFWVPDESGMGGEWSWPGRLVFEEGAGWYVQINMFRSRRATDAEIERERALDYPGRGHSFQRAYEAPTAPEPSETDLP